MSKTQSNDLPSIAGILAPIVTRVPIQQQKILIALAERQAAKMYRKLGRPRLRSRNEVGFLACAKREEDIASRVESLDPDARRNSAAVIR